MRKFICISGKAQNGKDTIASMIKEALNEKGYSVLIIHQADLLKFVCQKMFGWDGNKDEKGRTLLQYVGTQVVRYKSPDFWVDFIEKITDLFEDVWEYIIVPDTRFPNEIEKLKTPTSEVTHIRIIRDGFISPLTLEQQKHPSETALDDSSPDYIIQNDGSLESLRNKINLLVPLIVGGCCTKEDNWNADNLTLSQKRRLNLCKKTTPE